MVSLVKSASVILLLSLCVSNCVGSSYNNEYNDPCVSCYPRDSCVNSDLRLVNGKTCECDSTCYRRGTCCIDSPYVDPRPSNRYEVCPREKINAVDYNFYFEYPSGHISHSFFQVTKCDRSWRGSLKVKQLCEVEISIHDADFMVAIPVTNTKSGITYKNYFCALCNNDIEGSVLWDVRIFQDNEPKSEITDRFYVEFVDVVYDATAISGFSVGSTNCSTERKVLLVYSTWSESYIHYYDPCLGSYERVTVTLSIPQQVQHLVKGCHGELISCCSPDWTDVRVKALCGSYLGIIKGPHPSNQSDTNRHQYFHNAHCALCNNMRNFEGYSCESFSPTLVSTPSYPTSEIILFEHLLSETGCLGNNAKYLWGLSCRSFILLNSNDK